MGAHLSLHLPHGVGDHGLGDPLHELRGHGGQDEARVELRAQRVGHEDVHLVDAGERLHARRQVHRARDESVLHPLAGAHESRQARPAMDADAHGQRRQALASELRVVLADCRAHRERRAHRVVALPRVRLQRTEAGEDTVADEGRDVPAVLVNVSSSVRPSAYAMGDPAKAFTRPE